MLMAPEYLQPKDVGLYASRNTDLAKGFCYYVSSGLHVEVAFLNDVHEIGLEVVEF